MKIHEHWFSSVVLCGMVLCLPVISAAQAGPDKNAADKSAASPVVYFGAAKVDASFAKGSPLVETTPDGHYAVLAARREKPGQSELHANYTDVIYVVDGTATFVTGGEMVDGAITGIGEVRGASIKGGTSHKLAKGDVIVVPNDTPHQFVETSNPFLYFVVKVK